MAKYLCAFLSIFLLTTFHIHAQFIDNYGVGVGLNVANQTWYYKKTSQKREDIKSLLGPSISLFADKEVNKWSSFRVQFGYIQKGYRNEMDLVDDRGNSLGKLSDKSMNLHLFSFDLAMKFQPVYRATPSPRRFIPYAVLGIRNDFRVGNGSLATTIFDKEYTFTDQLIEDGEYKYNLGGTVGIGVTMWYKFSIELEFNPTINTLYSNDFIQVREYCYGLRFGYNISEHFQK